MPSAAADALGVTEPTVGRRLAAPEARLGAKLCRRSDGFRLSSSGRRILAHADNDFDCRSDPIFLARLLDERAGMRQRCQASTRMDNSGRVLLALAFRRSGVRGRGERRGRRRLEFGGFVREQRR
jgi:DNA-binding transcriptional LysR family regulator